MESNEVDRVKGKTYILGFDKTGVDMEAVRLTFYNVFEGTLVPTNVVCDDLKLQGQLVGWECHYKASRHYCYTLCGNCIEVLKLILDKVGR